MPIKTLRKAVTISSWEVRSVAIAMVLMASVIWGMIGPLTHIFVYSPLVYTATRALVPTLILHVYFAVKRRSLLWFRYTRMMSLISVLNVLRIGLFFLALSMAPISYIIFFLYLWPLFAMFLAVPFLRERLTGFSIAMGVLALVGSAVMEAPNGFHLHSHLLWAGVIMAISAFANALSVVLIKAEREHYSPMEIIFYQNGFGAVLGVAYLIMARPHLDLFAISYLSAYGFMIGIVSFYLYYGALRSIDTKTASFLSYTELIVAFGMGVTVLHETIHPVSILGGVLIVIAVLATFFQRTKVL